MTRKESTVAAGDQETDLLSGKQTDALIYLAFCDHSASFAEIGEEIVGGEGLSRWKHRRAGQALLEGMLRSRAVESIGSGYRLTERGRIAAAMAMIRKRASSDASDR